MSEQSPRMGWSYPSREDDPWYDAFQDFVIAVDGSSFAGREDRSIIWSDGGTVSWDLGTETLTWTDTINIYSPIGGKLLQIAASTVSGWANGDVVYVDVTRQPSVNTTKTFSKASVLPSTDDAIAFGVRIGDVIYLRTGMSLGDGDSSTGGIAPVPGGGGSSLTVEDEGSTVDSNVTVMDFVGSGVTASQTAPGNVEVDISGVDATAIHTDGSAEISGITEDTSPAVDDIFVAEDVSGGNVKRKVQSQNLIKFNSFTEEASPQSTDIICIEDASDSYNKKKVQIINLPGGVDTTAIHKTTADEFDTAALKGVPVITDRILIEDSTDSLNKKYATLGTLPGGSSVDIRTHAIIVGNSIAGDTSDDCDYLDIGDGAQLQAALTAAGAGDVDVFVRRGSYVLGSAGSPSRFSVPDGVRVIGAGRNQTFIQTEAAGGSGGAFFLNDKTELSDLYIICPVPTAVQDNTADAIIESWYNCDIRRVVIEFVGAWAAIADPTYVKIDAAFGFFGSGAESWTVFDLGIVDGPQLAGGGGSLMHGVWVDNGFTPSGNGKLDLRGFYSNGLERGVRLAGLSHCNLADFYMRDLERYGVALDDCNYTNINSGRVQCDGTDLNAIGIDLVGSEFVSINSVVLENASNNGDAAIHISSNSHYCNVYGCRSNGNWANNFIEITGSSAQCIVVGNHANGDGITDSVGTSEIAHNVA